MNKDIQLETKMNTLNSLIDLVEGKFVNRFNVRAEIELESKENNTFVYGKKDGIWGLWVTRINGEIENRHIEYSSLVKSSMQTRLACCLLIPQLWEYLEKCERESLKRIDSAIETLQLTLNRNG